MHGVQTFLGRIHRVVVPYLRLSYHESPKIRYVAFAKNQKHLVARLGLAQIHVRGRSITRMPEVRNQSDGVTGRYIRSSLAIAEDSLYEFAIADPDFAIDCDGRVGEKIPAHITAADISS